MRPCSLVSLATAVPPHVMQQQEAKATARRAFGRKNLFDKLSTVFDNAAIAKRHLVAPPDWYEESHGWRERNTVYLEASEALFIEAAEKAIEGAGLEPGEIDGVVTVSTTGIATPSLEARVGPRLGLRPDVRRIPVFGLGCAGGVNGLSLASRLARAEPGATVLLVALELSTFAFRSDRVTKADLVATALFGDGAAAAILRAGPTAPDADGFAAPVVEFTHEHTWPDTLDIMG